MRIMGLDFGSKTVGVAVSDPLGLTAQSLEIIRRKSENKLRQTYARIEELAAQYEVEKFVVGLPKNMNATEGERAEKSRAFADALFRRTGIEVVMWDERLTTVAADRTMMEAGIRREDRKRICGCHSSFLYITRVSGLSSEPESVDDRMTDGNNLEKVEFIPDVEEKKYSLCVGADTPWRCGLSARDRSAGWGCTGADLKGHYRK